MNKRLPRVRLGDVLLLAVAILAAPAAFAVAYLGARSAGGP